MLSIINPVGESMSIPPITCVASWVEVKIINLWRKPNVLLDYFLQDTFAIFLN